MSDIDISKYFEGRDKLVADTLMAPHESVSAESERMRAAYCAGAGDHQFYLADMWLKAFRETYALSGRPWQIMLIALEAVIRSELEDSSND